MIYVMTGFLVGVAVGLAMGLLLWRDECGRIESIR
jgi:ABC-type nitrate/sulfonate/bicarbonate transport system permease component